MTIKSTLKTILPDPVRQPLSNLYWGKCIPAWDRWTANTSPIFRAHQQKIRSYHNKHYGHRCFVLGNGPSLRSVDFTKLQGEYTIGTNRIYLLFDEINFIPTYYVAINTLLINQCVDDIRALDLPKFISWRGRRFFDHEPNIIFLNTDYTGPRSFQRNITERIFEGGTVTFVALQLAYYLGFTEVILMGVDHHYIFEGTPNTVEISNGNDLNHFSPFYFPQGFKWQLPDLDASRDAYILAQAAFIQDGRIVLDGTREGRLDVFPKIDLKYDVDKYIVEY